MYRSYWSSNISDMDDEDEQYGAMPAELSDVEVSCEATSNADNIRSSTDDRKCLVRKRRRDVKLFDNSQGYIYNKFGSTNSGKSSNFGLPHVRKNKGSDQPSNSLSAAICDHQVIVDGPEIASTKEFDVHSFQDWSKVIPTVCRALMRKARDVESIGIGKPYDVDSSIELRPMNGNLRSWRMFLRRDGVQCYRKYGRKNQTSQKHYVDYVKRTILDYKMDNLEELNKPIINIDIPKLYKCPTSCGKSKVKCEFYVCEPCCIKKTRTYYVAARSTAERVITICPHEHESNERWVQTKSAWDAVWSAINDIQTSLKLKEFPVERIYINLGRWQSQAEKGRLVPGECHAHINVVLTRRTIEACRGRSDVFGILQDSIFAPMDYFHFDMLALADEIERRGRATSVLFNYRRSNHFCNLIVPSKLADYDEYFTRDEEFSDGND